MNEARRKVIETLIIELNTIEGRIETIKDDESDSFENLPDGVKGREKGEQMEASMENLQEAMDLIENVIDRLNAATE